MGRSTRGILRAFAAKGLDSSEARVQWAVKVDEFAEMTSTRRAVVGQRRSAICSVATVCVKFARCDGVVVHTSVRLYLAW
jgi:hypothetical protein